MCLILSETGPFQPHSEAFVSSMLPATKFLPNPDATILSWLVLKIKVYYVIDSGVYDFQNILPK